MKTFKVIIDDKNTLTINVPEKITIKEAEGSTL
jgi:hypothetical protein